MLVDREGAFPAPSLAAKPRDSPLRASRRAALHLGALRWPSSLYSAADDDVGRALDHLARTAAMLILIAHAVGGLAVDEHGAAADLGGPGVGAAARHVDPGVVDPDRRQLVHVDVGRSDDRGTDRGVRAGGAAVGVRRDVGLIAESTLAGHGSSWSGRSGEAPGGHGTDAADHRADRYIRRGERRDRARAEDIGDHRTHFPQIIGLLDRSAALLD